MDDAAARDAIARDLDRTLFVEAGAGTGKTTALVGRVVELVRSGVRMREIAAITFTEAAAAELRDRVRQELERTAAHEPHLRDAVAEVDEAAVSTLHSFAQRILAEHPVEAGLPPRFEVLDEIRSSMAFDERWAAFLDAIVGGAVPGDVLLRGIAAGLRWHTVREAARTFGNHWDRLEDLDLEPGPPPAVELGQVFSAIDEVAALRGHCTSDGDALAAWIDGVVAWRHRAGAAGSDLDVLHHLAHLPNGRERPGARTRWGCDIETVRAARDAVLAAADAILTSARRHVLGHVLAALRRLTLDAVDQRRADGALEFHDLLVLAQRLVANRPDVRESLQSRYRYLLVDEFQDTDPLQVELAASIAGDAPGRLFFVGDAMQSIYRFRRADIALFSKVKASIDDPLTLTENWRSVPGILAFVNAFFVETVGDGDADVQPAYHPLSASRPPLGRPCPVVLLGGPHEKVTMSLVREREAADVADVVRRVRDDGWQLRSGRGAAYRDIAILLPTRALLPELEIALEDAGVPFRVESASLVWGTQEVRDLLNVLRAIDDPADEVALVAALRTSALGCGDDDLLAFRQAGGRWDLRREPPASLGADHAVTTALAELRRLHDERWWCSVSAMVDRVLRELRFFELAFAHTRPRDHWRRLRWVLDQARAFEEEGGGGLRQFVSWASQQASDDVRVKESPLPESDDDAVRILTVHGAKGLQFPVVVVAGLNRLFSAGGPPAAVVHWDGDGRPEVKGWGGFETAGFAAADRREQAMARHEQLRLLYVALTRAEDHLVVSVHHTTKGDSQAQQLWRFAGAHPDLWRSLPVADLRLQFPPSTASPLPDPDAAARRRAWQAWREGRVEGLRRVPVLAATAVAGLGSVDGEPDADDQPWRRGRAGTAIGRAVHATLQVVDLATGQGLADIARAQAAVEGVDASAAEVERLAAAALASASVRQAVTGGRYWRELYVASPLPGRRTALEGFVDLLFEMAAGFVVVDYKTDQVRAAGDVDAAVGRYRLQGASYVLALRETLSHDVLACRFVFLSGGRAVERELRGPELEAAVDEVRALLV